MWTIRTIIIALLVFDVGIHFVSAMVISSSKLVPCEVLPNGMIALIDQSSDDQPSSSSNNENQTMCNIPIYSPVIKIGSSTLDEIFTEANKDSTKVIESSVIPTSTIKPATACDGVMVDLDMCLTPGQDREMADDIPPKSTKKTLVRKKRKIVKDPTGRWPHNTIPYEIIENDFTVQELRNIIDAFTEYEIHTCIIFKPATAMDINKLIIMGGHGCYSNIGMIGGTQRLVLDKGNCRKKRVIMHELGHAIGMVHEHQRWDRDQFITILRHNVRPDVMDQFRKFSETVVDTTRVPYDYLSIMHYGGNFFSKDGMSTTIQTNNVNYQDLIGRTEQLSFIDIKAVNLMYKCNARCPTAHSMACPWDGFQDKYCECRCSDGQVCQQNPELTNLFIRPSNPFLGQIFMPNAGIMSGQQQFIYESNPRNYPIEYPYSGHLGIPDLVMQPSPYSNFIYDRFSLNNLLPPSSPFIPSFMHQPTVTEQLSMLNHSQPTTSPTIASLNETFPANPTTQSQTSSHDLNNQTKVTIPTEVTSQVNYTTERPTMVTDLASVQILNLVTTTKPPTPKHEPSMTAVADVPMVASPFRKHKQAPVEQIHLESSPFSVAEPNMSLNHNVDIDPMPNENSQSRTAVEPYQQIIEGNSIPFPKTDRQWQNANENYLPKTLKKEPTIANLLANEHTNNQAFHKNQEHVLKEHLKISPLKEQLMKIRAQLVKLENERQQVRTKRILESKSQRQSQQKRFQQSHFPPVSEQTIRNLGNIRNNRFRGRNRRPHEIQNTLRNTRRQPRTQSAFINNQATLANGYKNTQLSSDQNTPIARQNVLNRRNFNTATQNQRRFNNMRMNNNRNTVNYNMLFQQNVNTQSSQGTNRDVNNMFSSQRRNIASNRQTGSRSFNNQGRNRAALEQAVNRGFRRSNPGQLNNQQSAANIQRANSQRLNNVRMGGNALNSRTNINVVNRQSSFPQYSIQNRGRAFQTVNTRNRNTQQNQNAQRMFQNSRGIGPNSMGIRQNSIGVRQNPSPALNGFRSQQNSQIGGNSRLNRQNSFRARFDANRMQYSPMRAMNPNFRMNQPRNNTRIASPNAFNSNDGNVSPQPATASAYFVSPFEGPVDSWL